MTMTETAPTKSKLILDSLEVINFRAFRHLEIPRLGRVNLITGKNNVGKSSLLEALLLYAVKGEPAAILRLLEERDELRRYDSERFLRNLAKGQERAFSVRHLFYGRGEIESNSQQIQVGAINSVQNRVSVSTSWAAWFNTGFGYRELRLVQSDDDLSEGNALTLSLIVDVDDIYNFHFPLNQDYTRDFFRTTSNINETTCAFISSKSLSVSDISTFWDSAVLLNLEDEVINAMRLISKDIQKINLIGDNENGHHRIPVVKVESAQNSIPLKSLGDGVNRLFGLSLALVKANNGIFLADEIENGLHYSILPAVWRFIFQVARRLNVQVFATTHSWDCIEAFQKAAEEDKQEEGVLVRLENKNGDVTATVFDERRLAIVTREQIEVR